MLRAYETASCRKKRQVSALLKPRHVVEQAIRLGGPRPKSPLTTAPPSSDSGPPQQLASQAADGLSGALQV